MDRTDVPRVFKSATEELRHPQAGAAERLFAASGEVRVTGDRLTSFLYELMHDHLTPGKVEALVQTAAPDTKFTNGWLAMYAEDLADRLRAG